MPGQPEQLEREATTSVTKVIRMCGEKMWRKLGKREESVSQAGRITQKEHLGARLMRKWENRRGDAAREKNFSNAFVHAGR